MPAYQWIVRPGFMQTVISRCWQVPVENNGLKTDLTFVQGDAILRFDAQPESFDGLRLCWRGIN